MNLNLIYEGKNYQFDIPKDVTINYIKEIASKIFHYEDKGLQLFFKDNNLNNFNDKKFVNQLLKDNENNITIHLIKINISNKSNNILSNESTADTNNHNDKYYKELKSRFIKVHLNYKKKINVLSNFKEKIHEIFDKLIIIIKGLRNSILKIDNILTNFYRNKNYDKLIKLFEENNQSYVLTEKDYQEINDKIQTLIDDYKYIISQNNFHINVNNFMELETEKLQDFNKQFESIQNNNTYDEMIHELDKIFDFSYINNQNNNSNINIEKVESNNDSNLLNNSFDLKEKQIELPKIEKSNSKEKTINHFSDNSKISKKIRLIKENENKNIISLTNKKTNNFLPEINSKNEEKKLFALKLFKNSHSKIYKNQKNEHSLMNETSSHIIDKLLNKTSNKFLHKEHDIKDLNLTINNIKPKIMEKSEEKKKSHKNENLHHENKNWNIVLNSFNHSKNPKLLIPRSKENSICKSPSKIDRNEKNNINNIIIKYISPSKTDSNEKNINDNTHQYKTPSKTDINENNMNDNIFQFKSPSRKHRHENNINNNTFHRSPSKKDRHEKYLNNNTFHRSPSKKDRHEKKINNNTINNSKNNSTNQNVTLDISILSNRKIKKPKKKISNKLINFQKNFIENKDEKEKEKEKTIQFKLETQKENKLKRPEIHYHTVIYNKNELIPSKARSNKTVVNILLNEIQKDENLNENLNSLSPIKKKRDKNILRNIIKDKSIKSVKLFEGKNINEQFENFYKKHQENNIDDIEKLAKDLLYNTSYKNKSNTKEEILVKTTLIDSKMNTQKKNENKIDNSNNDCNSEIIENEGKKKKKKLFNKFDFII